MRLAGLDALAQLPWARPSWSAARERRWRAEDARLPHAARADGIGPNANAHNPPLYYAVESLPYRAGGDFFARAQLMRLGSVLLYLGVIALTWALAGEVVADAWRRTLATAVVVLLPLLGFLGGIVNPDMLLVFEWAAFVVLAARLLRLGPSPARLAAVVAVTGAAVYTHGRGLAIVPPAALAVVLALARHRSRRTALAAIGVATAVATAAVLVVLRPWDAGGGVYEGQAAGQLHAPFSVGQFARYLIGFYVPRKVHAGAPVGPNYGFRQVFVERFFGGFGSLDVTFPSAVNTALEALVVLGLGALAVVLVRRRGAVAGRRDLAAVLAVTVLSLLALLHWAAYRLIVVDPHADPLLVGRYLLPLAPLFGCAVAIVVGALPRRLAPAAAGGVLGGGVLLALGGLGLSLARFYA
jgi:4-amino-4-deoxy-L-arabinose transferase-like glycosyltransferase